MSEVFYVYEHTRNDTNEIFYVGKGKVGSRRSKTRNGRNQYWHNVVNKAGFTARKKIVEIIDEELSFLIEIERISQLRELGFKLCNLTDGGEGLSNPSAVTRAKLSEVNTGENNPFYSKKHSEGTLIKMRASALARPKVTFTCPYCLKEGGGGAMKQYHFDNCLMNPAASSRPPRPVLTCPHCEKKGDVGNMKQWHFDNCLKNPSALPRPEVTKEIKARMSAGCLAKPIIKCPYCEKEGKSNMERYHFDNCQMNPSALPRPKVTEETRARMSESRRNMSAETRARLSVSQLEVPKVTCPYCAKAGRTGAMHRWHFDNCRNK